MQRHRKQTNKENINFLEDEDARSKALEMFTNCLDALGPTVEIRSRRVGGPCGGRTQ